MRCLIVDDEPLAVQLLSSHVARVDNLVLEKTCSNAMEALLYLRQHPVDLMLLDISMPKISGISLLQALHNRPKVIITTAYREYAFNAYDLDVIDYLLKPISFERFLRAISKVAGTSLINDAEDQHSHLLHDFDHAYIYFKKDREMVKVFLKDIQYIEGLRDYVRVVTVNGSIITYNKLSYLEQKLPENKFIRLHRSFIVALDRIHKFDTTHVKLDDYSIPIGRNYKNEAIKAITRNDVISLKGFG
ncbi:response regulator [Pedobacter sp. HMF7647]|uniref:Response regulator n=1 Tax=Hufsiella arboris TaxID=2695275 RepID=A0A7K1Y4S8_9SPHI|nr:LytTR family DNA-binding domain-containing protein [Hufsiella arboris]MXV49587.1 response regulator [Hufsiella arboris]